MVLISEKVIEQNSINLARKIVLVELEKLKNNYFPSLSTDEFCEEHIFPASEFLKKLQARCIYKGLLEHIVSPQLLELMSDKFNSNFGLYHAVFLRFHHPKMKSNENRTLSNVTATPLHYDNYIVGKDNTPLNTITNWIPLQDIDENTGSLCYSLDSELIEMIGTGFSPEEFHNNQILNEKYIDTLKNHLKTIKLESGQIAYFDNKLLHGSTYAPNKVRISCDLRWVENANFPNDSVSKGIEKARKHALENLYLHRDYQFIYSESFSFKYFFIHLKYNLRRVRLLSKMIRFLRNQFKKN
jgi:hypothetical protein